MSRHRNLSRNRYKVIALVAAGAFTVATASTAAALTLAPGGSAPSAAPAKLTESDQINQPQSSMGSQQAMLVLLRRAAEISIAEQVAAQAKAAQELAAKRAAAERAAAERAAAEKAAAQQAAAQQAATSAAQPQASSPPAVSGPSGSPQQIAEAMLGSFGWPESQLSCLDPLWAQESGWSVTAYNAGSGAYGIPQALPGSKMASAGPDWQTDAATQITWGLEYIQSTYGSPCAAWAHEEATGWY